MIKSDINGLKEFISILQKTNLKNMFYLSFFLFIGILIESLGLGLLYPIVDILVSNDSNNMLMGFDLGSKSNKIIFLLSSVFIIYLIKTVYLVLFAIKQSQFIAYTTERLSNEMFKGYLYSPFNFHINNNSSELVKNIQVELSNFTSYLSAVIFLISDFILILAIVGTLIYLNPLGTLIMMIYLIIGALFFLYYSRKKLDVWGKERIKTDTSLSLTLNETLKGIKMVKVSSLESVFIAKYKKENSAKFQFYWKQLTFGQLPRLYIEIISIFGFIFLIFLLLGNSLSLTSIIPILSIYMAAFFRVLPSINRMLSSYQQLRYFLPSVKLINQQVNYNRTKKENISFINSFNDKIELKNISFKYNKKYIFKNLNLEIKKGKTYGIKGPSGSGKSTLASILIGLLAPTEGKIIIDGQEHKNFKWQDILSYVSQDTFMFDKTILENITIGQDTSKINLKKVEEVLKKTNIFEYTYSLENNIYSNLGENAISFSGGQIQRLALARALYNDPEIIVLDEFTSALDNENESKLFQTLKDLEKDVTVVVISHRDNLESICDEIINVN